MQFDWEYWVLTFGGSISYNIDQFLQKLLKKKHLSL